MKDPRSLKVPKEPAEKRTPAEKKKLEDDCNRWKEGMNEFSNVYCTVYTMRFVTGSGKSWRESGGEPLGNPSFLYAVAIGAHYSPKHPDICKGNFAVTLGQVAFSAMKVSII
jgi:hypothetical protein